MAFQRFVVGVVLGAAMLYGTESSAQGRKGTVALVDRQGKAVGTLTLDETPNGVLIRGELVNLPQGTHGFHIHDKGACTPTFDAAGGHFNPSGASHGFDNKGGPHLGDLPNVRIPASGRVLVEVMATHVTLGDGPNSLTAGDGTAIVVHTSADDYRTDPAGGAGDRIACGVVRQNNP